jgi:Zn-dependent peptidase ImmA (M78 family)
VWVVSVEIHSTLYKYNENYRLAKSRAIKAREKYGIKSGPVTQPVFNFLEEEGCNVITIDLGKTSATGMYIKRNDTKLVLIHKNRVLGQQNFTAIHELSHVLFDEEELLDICLPEHFQKRDRKEILADMFAAHFLMPEEDVLKDSLEFKSIEKKEIIILSARYRVSFIAMALRLVVLGKISRDDFEKYKKMSTRGKIGAKKVCEELGIDHTSFVAPNDSYISQFYFELLINVYHKANISRSVLIDYYLKPLEEELKLNLDHFVKYADDNYPDYVEWDDI